MTLPRVIQLHAEAMDSDADMHGTAVDLGAYVVVGKENMKFIWCPGVTGADTDETYDCKIQESSLGTTVSSDWTDHADGAFTQVTAESAYAVQELTLVPTKQYVRDLVTLGGTTATIENFVVGIAQGRWTT